MKIKEGFILSRVGDDTVAVASGKLSREFPGVVVLGGSGEFLWNILSGEVGASEAELLKAVLSEYDIDRKTAGEDIAKFIEKLKSAGLLED